ncbi:hypothetical protein L3556_06890 [Candidatus Synechococcus calcipolaris G9]|uniref:Uncharacterized protein n=1 Tax=Candidatus Synechococcus calcipolaris G9 TaxID=1497997 RepID=A0ABT6EXX2_9SYNE|nr:hypothetical protein [Candidatus Synechococcus calcipolaris]MDG2990660.1 hypothetical protein [Candidatus Synechococcus calcipolaris G9]
MDADLTKIFAKNGLVDKKGKTIDLPDDDADGWRMSDIGVINFACECSHWCKRE